MGRLTERFLNVCMSIAGIVVLAIMGVTVVDVIGRYVLNRPLAGSFEITQLLLVLMIFAGLPAVCASGSHIRVDIFVNLMSRQLRRIVEWICAFAIAATLCFLTIVMWGKAGATAEIGDVTTYLRIPVGPFAYFISISCGIASIAFVEKLFRGSRPNVAETERVSK